jgi:UDP-N-acetyl-D-glucosamine dehydrogenase
MLTDSRSRDRRSAGPDEVFARLAESFRLKQAKLGVIGLGYVGLPICLAAVNAGFKVLGLDIDPGKPEALKEGQSYLRHIPAAHIASAMATGRFEVTSAMQRLSEPDALLICVPTPLSAHLDPDISFIVSTAETITQYLRRGQLVVLESTTYPGTTDEVLRPILEKSGLQCGRDFYLAFSPEREDPGNAQFSTPSIPKVIGADDPAGLELASLLYGSFVTQTVTVSTTRIAEAVKLTENIFRAVNIALANELKIVYGAMGIDIWEVIDAAKTKPFGFMPFYPGPGLGGHCIPIDPFYLTWKAREFGIATRFIELAGQINSSMPQHVLDRLALALDTHRRKGLNGSRILVLGVAYKKNIDDMRESPALRLMELIEARGATASYYDPFVPLIPRTREHAALAGRQSVPWSRTVAKDYDAVLIVTDHDGVDYQAIAEHAKLVVDTRNVCRRTGVSAPHLVLA